MRGKQGGNRSSKLITSLEYGVNSSSPDLAEGLKGFFGLSQSCI